MFIFAETWGRCLCLYRHGLYLKTCG